MNPYSLLNMPADLLAASMQQQRSASQRQAAPQPRRQSGLRAWIAAAGGVIAACVRR